MYEIKPNPPPLSEHVGVRLSGADVAFIDGLARRAGCSRSDVLRHAVADLRARHHISEHEEQAA